MVSVFFFHCSHQVENGNSCGSETFAMNFWSYSESNVHRLYSQWFGTNNRYFCEVKLNRWWLSTDQNDHRSFSSFAVCRIVNIKLIGAAYSHRSQKRWRKRLVKCISCLRRFSNARRCRSLHDMQWSEMAHTALHQRSTRLNAMPMQVARMDYEISRGTSGWCFILFVVFADRLSAKCSRRVGLPKMIAEELAKMRDVAFCMAKTQHHFSLEKTGILSSHRLDMRTSLFLCRSKSIEETSAWYLIDGSRFTKKKKNVCVLAISHLYMSQHSSTFPTDRARALKFPHRCPAS